MKVKDFVDLTLRKEINLYDFYKDLFEDLRNDEYDAFITLLEEEVFRQLDNLPKGKLYGVPFSVKDAICTKGVRTTAGSRMLEDYIPTFDATVIERIKREGGVIIGKTSMDEFGLGGFSINGIKIPKNPNDKNRVTGGSSGGSAVATKIIKTAHVSIAESTGGSISCPASFCGVFGLTPTYGRIPRYGLIDYANSLDKIGLMSKYIDDLRYVFPIVSGFDPRDMTSLKNDVSLNKTDISKIKIGVPKEYFGEGVDPKVSKIVWNKIKDLESKGAKVKEVSLPHTNIALSAYYIIAMCEVSTNLAKLCGMRYGFELNINKGESFNDYFSRVRSLAFGEEAKRRILLGTYARMSGYRNKYYLQAMKIRTLVINDFKKAFKDVDVLITPTMPIIAPKFDEVKKLSPLESYKMDILTVPPNLAGVPMLSCPAGQINGLPVGIHIISDHLREDLLISVGEEL